MVKNADKMKETVQKELNTVIRSGIVSEHFGQGREKRERKQSLEIIKLAQ